MLTSIFLQKAINVPNVLEDHRGYWTNINNETFVKNEWQNMRIGLKLQNVDNGIFLVTTEVMMINMSISIFKPTIFVMYGFSDDNLSTIFVFRPRKLTS